MGVSSTKLLVPGILFIIAIGTLLFIGRKPVKLVKKFLPVLVLALVVWFSQVLLSGDTPWFSLKLGFWEVTGYREGAYKGLLLSGHMLAGAAMVIFLTETTSFSQLIFAVTWFRIPSSLIEIITIAHRYIYVFADEVDRVRKAQRMRLGYRNWRLGWKSAGTLGGMVILRAFDKSERLFKAMSCRGYRGQIQVSYNKAMAKRDLVPTCLAGIILLGLFSVGYYV